MAAKDITPEVTAAVREIVRPHWEPNHAFGHGWDHAERISAHAWDIAGAQGQRPELSRCTCLLVDAGLNLQKGRTDHITRSLEIADEVMTRIPTLAVHRAVIREAIAHHEGEFDCSTCEFGESLVVHDADTLDRLGWTGIAMTIAYGRWVGRPFASAIDPFCDRRKPGLDAYTLDYIIYLRSLHARLCTFTAKAIAETKALEWQRFVDELRQTVAVGEPITREKMEELALERRPVSSKL